MSYLTSGRFWLATAERAVKTFAQTLAASLAANAAFDVFATAWKAPLGMALGAALLSALTSVASGAAGDGTPSALPWGETGTAPEPASHDAYRSGPIGIPDGFEMPRYPDSPAQPEISPHRPNDH